jgi:NADH-quinone oxidoreductase subunit D
MSEPRDLHVFSDSEEMEISFGPQHPATHGVLRVMVRVDGEKITDAKPVIGYLHRGTEKIFERETYNGCIPHTDRMDYTAAATNNQGLVGAVEKMMGIVVPPRAAYIRMVLAELQRIASHIIWLGTHALDIGAQSPFFYTFEEREKILDLYEEYCGARLTLNCMRVGGLPFDLPEGWVDRCRAFIDQFPGKLADWERLLTGNRIWKLRTIGIGVISAADAVEWGLTGPPLRGSGLKWDIRKVFPYDRYDEVDFEIPVGKNGDTYDRYLVRMEEMRQSVRIVRQCLDRMPDGPVMAKVPKVIKPPVCELYFSVEGPKGELGYYVVSDGSDKPYRLRVRPACFINLQALPELVRGHLIADMIAVIGTSTSCSARSTGRGERCPNR